ncbi:MCM-domain-containing protein [Ramicandelaber brevisporus]|nr:MCM-domain-containing protein [Ramicandelaber brevisporus]
MKHYSVPLDLLGLLDSDPALASQIISFPTQYLQRLDQAAYIAQEQLRKQSPVFKDCDSKQNVHVRLANVPMVPGIVRMGIPRSNAVGRLVAITGTVIRTGIVKMMETAKMWMCTKCKNTFPVKTDIEQYNSVAVPNTCRAFVPGEEPCNSTKFQPMQSNSSEELVFGTAMCIDYQEVKVQEHVNKLSIGTIPSSINVLLMSDLVEKAKSGDDVTIIGVVIRRWQPIRVENRPEIELTLVANSVRVHSEAIMSRNSSPEESANRFREFWQRHSLRPFDARNLIIRSFCPQIFGMYVVKLSVLLVLIGGVARIEKTGMKVRGESHLLLVGDPGVAKSQFLKYAAMLVPRSVLTTGIGSSSAGLTVTAVREGGGEWVLEAGALVLADRGICCIDEFGSIREHDKVAILEAMEQQAISIAKAGIVCRLNTRCSVLAATNPKGKYDSNQPLTVNVALSSPLLSRFDLIFILLDTRNDDWDRELSTFILNNELSGHAGGHSLGLSPNGSAKSDSSRKSPSSSDLWDFETLQTYIAYVKSEIRPMLTPDSERVLSAYYRKQRSADSRNAARTTLRLLESMVRLAQAHARLMFRSQVTIRDAVVVAFLMELSMQGSTLLGIHSTLHADFPFDGEADIASLEKRILEALGLYDLVGKESPDKETD